MLTLLCILHINELFIQIFPILAVVLRFTQTTYNIGEGDALVQPMLTLSRPLSTDLTLQVLNSDLSATGKYRMVQIFEEEIIDEFDKFLVINQNLPYQIFYYVVKANVVPATVSSIFYLLKFSQCQFVNISLIKDLHYIVIVILNCVCT